MCSIDYSGLLLEFQLSEHMQPCKGQDWVCLSGGVSSRQWKMQSFLISEQNMHHQCVSAVSDQDSGLREMVNCFSCRGSASRMRKAH